MFCLVLFLLVLGLLMDVYIIGLAILNWHFFVHLFFFGFDCLERIEYLRLYVQVEMSC